MAAESRVIWFSARVLGACAAVTPRPASCLGKPQTPWRLGPDPSQAFWRTWPRLLLLVSPPCPAALVFGRRWATAVAASPTTCPLAGPPPEGRAGDSVQRALPRERSLCPHGLCGFSRSASPRKGRTEAELPQRWALKAGRRVRRSLSLSGELRVEVLVSV